MPNIERLEAAANIASGLAMDAIAACGFGHLGLPLGTTEIGDVFYGDHLRHAPPSAATFPLSQDSSRTPQPPFGLGA